MIGGWGCVRVSQKIQGERERFSIGQRYPDQGETGEEHGHSTKEEARRSIEQHGYEEDTRQNRRAEIHEPPAVAFSGLELKTAGFADRLHFVPAAEDLSLSASRTAFLEPSSN